MRYSDRKKHAAGAHIGRLSRVPKASTLLRHGDRHGAMTPPELRQSRQQHPTEATRGCGSLAACCTVGHHKRIEASVA